ncbi:hypothetical protein ABW19_dt0203858 [Dactylella cylindrospora]|nr:hypothetical protein ABW19_dt0203858 [Dactylella cylindrospora]
MKEKLETNRQQAVISSHLQLHSHIDAPPDAKNRIKVRSDTLEALIGAFMLDSGWDAVLEFAVPIIKPALEYFQCRMKSSAKDPPFIGNGAGRPKKKRKFANMEGTEGVENGIDRNNSEPNSGRDANGECFDSHLTTKPAANGGRGIRGRKNYKMVDHPGLLRVTEESHTNVANRIEVSADPQLPQNTNENLEKPEPTHRWSLQEKPFCPSQRAIYARLLAWATKEGLATTLAEKKVKTGWLCRFEIGYRVFVRSERKRYQARTRCLEQALQWIGE